ncbi:MAG: hypothetical protein PHQ27_10210 [Victivallales bacterium]|nr:hypothetical protein [Victivallales bacterium]
MAQTDHNSERGAALITVLCLILLLSLLAYSAVTYSKLSAMMVYPAADAAEATQVAESTFARVAWIILADRQNTETNRNVELGGDYYQDRDTDSEETRFLPDGIPHIVNFYSIPVQVRVIEMHAGLAVTSFADTLRQHYRQNDETAIVEALDVIGNRITDYTDSDDFLNEKGMEKAEYEERGLSPLPRNAAMQFREELLYVPGVGNFVRPDSMGRLNDIQLIPPSGMQLRRNASPPLFTASTDLLASLGNFETEDVQKIVDAVNAWYKDRTPLSDSLDELLLPRIRSAFNLRDTGYYTIFITPLLNNCASRTLVVSVRLNNLSGTGLHYYEWTFY